MEAKMRECLVSAVVIFVVGCSAPKTVPQRAVGPSAQDQEVALEIVWEGVLGMSVESRPPITWWVGCPDGNENTGCYDEYSTPGNINLIWIGISPTSGQVLNGTKISDTHFSVWLEGAWEWATYPETLAPEALVNAKTREAQTQLRTAGL